MAYDDNVAGRMGVGLGLGLFLGPFGLPFAAAADASQAEKRTAVLAELHRHCGGPSPVVSQANPSEVGGVEHTECIAPGHKAGDKLNVRGLGPVTVKEISAVNTQCGTNNSPPVQAIVIRTVTAPPASTVPLAPKTIPVSARPAESASAVKLRELNGMLKDGLITQSEYDAKKAEILKSF